MRTYHSPVNIRRLQRQDIQYNSNNPFNRQHIADCQSQPIQKHKGSKRKSPSRKTIDVNININININTKGNSNVEDDKKQQCLDTTTNIGSKAQNIFTRERTSNSESQQHQHIEYSDCAPPVTRINQKKQMVRGKSEPAFSVYTNAHRQGQNQAFQNNIFILNHSKPTNSTFNRSTLSNLHNMTVKASPLQYRIPFQLTTLRTDNTSQFSRQNAPSFVPITPVQSPVQSNRLTQNSQIDIVENNTSDAPSYIPFGMLEVMQPYVPEDNNKELNSERQESNQPSEVQTFKMQFEYTSPIKQIEQLMGNDNSPIQSPQKPESKGRIPSQNRLITIPSQECLTVNKGPESYINPEDFVGSSLSSIRSIPQRVDSSSLQKITSGIFLRRNESIKSYMEYFPYIIQQESHNAQNSSYVQSSNLKSSSTSVAQQMKVKDNQYILKPFNSSQSLARLQRSSSNQLILPVNVSGTNILDYKFDRRQDSKNSKLRDARVLKDIPKTRVPINNLALWDVQPV